MQPAVLQGRVRQLVVVEEVGEDVVQPLVGYLHDGLVAELAVERVGEAVGGVRGEGERLEPTDVLDQLG